MDHDHRIQCLDALRTHQEQASKLSHVIASLRGKAPGRDDAAAPRPDVILFTAQLMRHRISAALLTAELTAT